MATTVVVQQQPALRQSSPTPPLTPALTLNTQRATTPIPNKHIPYCSPGPVPSQNQIVTPPQSPPSRTVSPQRSFVLYPPDAHPKLSKSPAIYGVSAEVLAEAWENMATQPMVNPTSVFPWLHGLHPSNTTQLAFFVARKRSLRKVPRCLRGLTIIKAGGDLSRSRIRGSIAPDEVMNLSDEKGKGFLDCDPPEGFSVRNFHIQSAKLAQVSDIVVYGDDRTDHRIIQSVAERAAAVQRQWRRDIEQTGQSPETFNTFVLTSPFSELERTCPELIAIDSRGRATGNVLDFLQRERIEMCEMTKASEVSQGVYMGPSPNPNTIPSLSSNKPTFDVFIECCDHASMPDDKFLDAKLKQLIDRSDDEPVQITFPSSGSIMPPTWSQVEVDGIVRMCHWLYNLSHSHQTNRNGVDADGDIQMTDLKPRSRTVLIHCPDGYTETSLFGIAYFMFAEGIPLHEAWLKLHCEKKRNFFAYPSDVALLKAMQTRILSESPAYSELEPAMMSAPQWISRLDGSLPSRILPYMYLGNLTHANNPDMLRRLGIKRILSVGEPVSWTKNDWTAWGRHNLMFVDRVQDNGIDELGTEIEKCLEFIGKPCKTSLTFPAN